MLIVLGFLWKAFVYVLKLLWFLVTMVIKIISTGIGLIVSFSSKIIGGIYSFISTYELVFELLSLFIGITALVLMIVGKILALSNAKNKSESKNNIRRVVVIEVKLFIWIGAFLNLFVYTSKHGFLISLLIQIGVFLLYGVSYYLLYGDSCFDSSDSDDCSSYTSSFDPRKRDELSIEKFHHLYKDLSTDEKDYIDTKI